MEHQPVTHIVHIGRYHRKDDIRIFCKECRSLRDAGYEVTYITSDIYGDREGFETEGIRIRFYPNALLHIGIRHIFLRRIRFREIADDILRLRPDVIHVHEYEVIPLVRIVLKRDRKIRLVYDMHEDNPRQIGQWYRTNHGALSAWIAEKVVERKENRLIRKAACVFTATDYIRDLALKQNKYVFTVKNYPKADDICCGNEDMKERESNYCYAGGITEDRGITLLVKNSDSVRGKLLLAGNAEEGYLRELMEKFPRQWKRNVRYEGYLSRRQVNELYSASVAGLCILQEHPNYMNALPIKLFEYMAAGIPVVISDFPLWKQIVAEAECGITVNPYHEKEVAEAVNRLLSDRELAKRLGDNGRRAVKEKYSWEQEAEILVEAYRSILPCAE